MFKQCNLLFRMFTYFTLCFLQKQTLASLYIDALLNNVVICSQQLSNFNSIDSLAFVTSTFTSKIVGKRPLCIYLLSAKLVKILISRVCILFFTNNTASGADG